MNRRLIVLFAVYFLAIVAAYCDLSQDFESWPGPGPLRTEDHDNWSVINVYITDSSPISGSQSAVLDASSNPSEIISPQTTNGLQSISFDIKNTIGGANITIINIYTSNDGVSWGSPIASVTNSSTSPSNVEIISKTIDNSYVKFAKGSGTTDYPYIDNIVIKDSPIFFTFTNSIISPSTPLVNSPTTASVDIIPDSIVSNIVVLFHYSTNNSAYVSQVPSQAGNTYSGVVPAVSTKGSISRYYYSIEFDIPNASGIFNYFPSAGAASPATFTNGVTYNDYTRNQDFSDWTDAGLANHGWTPNNIFLDTGNKNGVLNDGGSESSFTSPLLAHGLGTFSWDIKNNYGGSTVYKVEISETTSPWTPLQSFTYTNSSTVASNIVATFMYNQDVYARISSTFSGYTYPAIDNIVASYYPADATISNVTIEGGYVYLTNDVTVSCEINSQDPDTPSDNYMPKIVYRFTSTDSWSTNDMSLISGSKYAGNIPAKLSKGYVDYFIKCDFDGYSYENAYGSESRSPAFSPDADHTESAPSTFHSYEVRQYRSEFDYLSITSAFANATMQLYDDYSWQGQIDMTIDPQPNLVFRILGFGEFTNGASEYSTDTNFWGDLQSVTVPGSGVADINGPAINAVGPFASPLVISINTKSRSYLMVRGYYQDFNRWSTADSDSYAASIFGIGNKSITNNFDSWPISSTTYTVEGDGKSSGGYFNTWDGPTAYFSGYAQSTNLYRIKDGKILSQRGDGTAIQQALELRPTSGGDAQVYPNEFNIDDFQGIGTFSFKYRISDLEPYYLIRNTDGYDWSSAVIEVEFVVNSHENDAAISLINHYDESTGEGFEAKFLHELGTIYGNRIDCQYLRNDVGFPTPEIHKYDVNNNSSLGAVGRLLFLKSQNNAGLEFLSHRHSSDYWATSGYKLYTTAHTVTGTNIALAMYGCDLNITRLKVRPARVLFQDNWTSGTWGETNKWYSEDMSGRETTTDKAFLISPYLPFTIERIRLNVDDNLSGGTNSDVIVYGSSTRALNGDTSGPAAGTIITNLYYPNTVNNTAYINLNQKYNYIWVVENRTNINAKTRIDDIQIYGVTDIDETFTTPADTNNWWQGPKGGWTHTTAGGGYWNHGGYSGDPVPFAVEVAPLETDYKPAFDATWTKIFTNSASNYRWTSVNIDLDALDPFVPHAEFIVPRIVNLNTDINGGHLIVDNINFSDWHGKTIGTHGDWRATEAWIQPTAEGKRHVELARDRAYINMWGTDYYQYLQSATSTNGISAVTFKYYVTDAPVTYDVYWNSTNNMHLDDTWTNNLAARFTNNTDSSAWETRTVTINEEGPRVVRIVNTSTNNKGTLMIDDLMTTDFAGATSSTWVANNVLITHKENTREFEPSSDPELRTCFLNLDAVTGTSTPQDPPEAYIESPYSSTGIGMISFWYKHFDNSGSATPGTIEFYVATNRFKNTSSWEYIGGLNNITNTDYEFFSQAFYVTDYNYLRIVNGTNGIANGRVCIDNILIKEPMGANILITNLTTIPAVPLISTPVSLQMEVTDNIFSASNLQVTAYWKKGEGAWGLWGMGSADGSFPMTNVSGSGVVTGVYVSAGQIPAQGIDDVVQFAVYSTFWGSFSNSPKTFRQSTVPAWYEPIDLNTNYGKPSPYYYTFSCTTGSVWINEYNILDDNYAPTDTNQFIELCGQENADISDWKIEILDASTNVKYEYSINPSSYLDMNTTNGFAFWLIGDDLHIANRKQGLTYSLSTYDGIRLVRSMGAWVDITMDGDHPDDDFEIESSIARINTGSFADDFQWGDPYAGSWSPGSANMGQDFINAFGGNPYLSIEILDMWRSGGLTYIVYNVIGTNYYLPPAPMFTTNIANTGAWQNVTSPSYDSEYPYPTWNNTYTSWWTTISAPGGVFHKISLTNLYTP